MLQVQQIRFSEPPRLKRSCTHFLPPKRWQTQGPPGWLYSGYGERDRLWIAAADAADEDDASQRTKTAGVKVERNHRYENNECFVWGKQGHKQWD